ncbi:MAG: hypothetical protein H6712_24135 [Myxococcales bacterium]|nr:hypothetical protein [Myxococcales bacterium]MCB9716969.1 hypothetical protein [Myxococcales bacterium]
MPAQDDRWDVVVVGLRDPSHANLVMVAAELAHYASLPGEDVERLLASDEEVEVLVNLDRSEAERAAQELTMLGAVVDLRLAMDDSGVFPVFKPDADRQVGVAVGGLIDDSATPPTVGEVRGALPSVEPDLEAGRMRARKRTPLPTRPAAPRGSGDPLDLLPMGDSGAHSLIDDLGGPPGIGEALPAPPPREPRREARAPSPSGYETHRPERAAASKPARDEPRRAEAGSSGKPKPKEPKDKARRSGGSVLGDIGGPSAEPEPPKLPARLKGPGPGDPGAAIELDFEAVGLSKPPRGSMLHAAPPPIQGPGSSGSTMPRRTRAGNIGGTGQSAAGRERGGGGLLEALRGDAVAITLLALGGSLIVSLIIAMQIQRSSARDTLPPLEEELAASLAAPAAVEAGQLRAPSAVEDEIDAALDGMERSFLIWWLALGVPVGLVLSRLSAR